MDPLVAHERAQEALRAVLVGVPTGKLDTATPCAEWTVRDIVGHVVAGNYRMADTVPPLLPSEASRLVQVYVESAWSAHEAFSVPGGLEREYPFACGALRGLVAAQFRTRDVLTHAWDVAKAIEQPVDFDPELAAHVLSVTMGTIPKKDRGPGRLFADQQPCPTGSPPADQLAAYLGRDVGWCFDRKV
jgi:uncharacterized protein (TIGR03086 family)